MTLTKEQVDQVKMLSSKGFGILDSKRALIQNNWDIEKAIAYLQSSPNLFALVTRRKQKMTKGRITPEMVVEAYKITGMLPMIETFASRDKSGNLCGCGIGTVLASRGYEVENGGINDLAEQLFGEYYTDGFYHGFDGYSKEDMEAYFDNEDFKSGFLDGHAARQAVIEAGYDILTVD